MEIRPCGQDIGKNPGRRIERRGHLPWTVGGGRGEAGNGSRHGGKADHLRHGQSRSRNLPTRSEGSTPRRHHRDGPVGLSQSGQQRPWLSFHFPRRSEEHTSELQSLMRISYAVFCLKKKNLIHTKLATQHTQLYT